MFSGRDCGRHFVFADELEGAEMESDGGAAADAFAGALERNYSRGRIADGGFSAGGRKDRGAVLAQCRFGAENISGGWDAAGGIALPQLGTVAGVVGRWKSNETFFSFQSFAIPATVYRYDLNARALDVWAKPAVPIDASAFESKQVWYESKDKTRVPMFLFYKKGLQLDGTNPALMTAYGGFD